MAELDHKKLKKVRGTHNLTQEQVAEKTDLSDRYIRKIESGNSIPAVTVMYTICQVYQQPMEEFIIDEKEGGKPLADK